MTFYYFADSYINFNSLVTDLFKIYKTRIWMSAINPASFATPTLGLQAPSGVGPGAVGHRMGGSSNAERRPNQAADSQAGFASGGQSGRPFQQTFNQSLNAVDRSSVPSPSYPPLGLPYSAYGAFGETPRPYMPGMMQTMDSYSGFPQGAGFPPPVRARFPNTHSTAAPHEQNAPSTAGQNDWVGAFQGLSLNTR